MLPIFYVLILTFPLIIWFSKKTSFQNCFQWLATDFLY